MNISFSYQCQSIEEFRALCAEFPQVQIKPKPCIPAKHGPFVTKYLSEVKQKSFRKSGEEIASGLSDEEIAFNRLQALETPTSDSPVAGETLDTNGKEVLPSTSFFGDDDDDDDS